MVRSLQVVAWGAAELDSISELALAVEQIMDCDLDVSADGASAELRTPGAATGGTELYVFQGKAPFAADFGLIGPQATELAKRLVAGIEAHGWSARILEDIAA